MADAIEGEVVDLDTPVELTNLTKHDENIVKNLEAAFHNGFNISEACQHAGISRDTYYDWKANDDVFSYRMSVAQSAIFRKAKQNITAAIAEGDPNISLRMLMLRDPDFKPKVQQTTDPELPQTRNKIKDFLDDTTDLDDTGGEPPAPSPDESRGEVAEAPTDIS